jgi:ATP-dependent Clp protease ATP-binding subunit ClpA
MFKAFTTSARKVVSIAEDEACALRHQDIGPEHLLLGAARCGGPAETLLSRLGIGEAEVRSQIAAPEPVATNGSVPEVSLSPDAVWALAAAVRRADSRDDRRVGSAHILLALTASESVQAILLAFDVTPEGVRDAVERFAQLSNGDSAHVATPVEDVRALLQIVRRDGDVAAWLAHRGVDEDEVRDAFRGLAFDQAESRNGG